MNTKSITCPCGECFEWEIPADEWMARFVPKLCTACEDKADEERQREQREKEAQEAERERQWILDTLTKETPPRFQRTSTTHPAFNRGLWEKAQPWRPTPEVPWLGLIGEGGLCKTRCAFLLLHELALEWCTRDFLMVTACDLHKAVTGQYDDDKQAKAEARELLQEARDTKILVFDDFGKAAPSPGYRTALFGIIDHRHAHNLCTIWTSNSPPEQLVAGMPEDMAGPLAGRLIECSTIITC